MEFSDKRSSWDAYVQIMSVESKENLYVLVLRVIARIVVRKRARS